MKIRTYIIAFSVLLGIGLGGCEDQLNINTDPNNAADVDVNLLLPSAEAGVAFAVGNTLQIYGGVWGQYWTQNPSSSQYRTLEQYNPAPSDFDNLWAVLNADALEDLQRIIDKSRATNRRQYQAVATLLKAYTVQLSTDLFGDIPYSEAFRGDKNILNPRFDRQEVIYDSLVVLVDEAVGLIDPSDPNHPGSDDLIYGGDMEKWLHFGHTLKLRIGLRMSEVNPGKAQSIVATLAGKDFIQSGESAQINYTSTGGNQNPLYSAIAGPVLGPTQNLVASSTAINFYNELGDPRLFAFYMPASNGSYVGLPQGNFNAPAGGPVSIPSPATGADVGEAESALAPVKLMTDYEAKFLQAEAAARGWLPGDAAALYQAGILDNFVAYEIDPADIYGELDEDEAVTFEQFYADPGVAFPATAGLAGQLEAIITQKWAAMNGNQNIEAWNEWRRTGYPSFFTPSVTSIIGAGRIPQIFLYPTVETTRNSNAPGQHQIYDRVWWDVR